VLGIFVFQATVAHATDYNYLPADVSIKQQEEKSALEYRLKSLEAQLQNNSASLIGNIDNRILELKNERDAKKSYLTGTYGLTEQIKVELSEIDSKYSKQIAELESQRSSYQSQIDVKAKEAEIAELKLKIQQLEYDKYTKIYEQAIQSPQKNITIGEYFDWLESLPDDQEVAQFKLLQKMNPVNAYKIEQLYRAKYPDFFAKKAQKATTTSIDSNVIEQVKEQIPVKKTETIVAPKVEQKPIVESPKITEVTPTPVVQAPIIEEIKTPEPPKETFVQKAFGFFKRLVFWK
jgi:hypothetical protein